MTTRRRHGPPPTPAPQSDARPGPLLPADWSHGAGPSAVRHRRQGLPRLRQRDRGHGPRARPSAGHRRHPRPGRPAHRPDLARIGFTEPISRAGGRARRDLPGAARFGHVPQFRLGGDRRRAQARAPRHRAARDHRVPRRVPRPDARARPASRPRISTTAPATSRCSRASTSPRTRSPTRTSAATTKAASAASLAILRSLLTSVDRPDDRSASILIEPVLGEGGYVPAPRPFLRGLRELCDEHGILLIADEVQSGYGRTGRMWAFEHAGIVPDVVSSPRRSPMACRCRRSSRQRELQERWGRGAHGSTYGGNPVACAAGLAVLETIHDEGLVANAVARGAELAAGLGSDRRRGRPHRRHPRARADDRRRVRARPRHPRAGRRRCPTD